MHIFFSVGEPSGDLHTARLIEALRFRRSDLKFSGFGGPLMEKAGCRIDFRLTTLSVMGFLLVIPLLWKFYRLVKDARRILAERRPDAVVLVDFPGFNWWIARAAKKLNIPVYYYLPPQLWAWASWRIHRMRKFVDHVLCCLPFEETWYRQRGVSVERVGHPFFDEAAERILDPKFMKAQRSKSAGPIIGILPGSRNQEVQHNFGIQLAVMADLARRVPGVRFLVASYKEEQRQHCLQKLKESGLKLPVEMHVGRTSEIIELAHECLMVSGSVSLELLARAKPAVVVFRVTRFTYCLGWFLIKCKYMSLPNLIADEPILPEFIPIRPEESNAEIARILYAGLADPEEHARRVARLTELREEVVQPGASLRCADAILNRMGHPPVQAVPRRAAA